MLTNTYFHSQFNPLSHSQSIQLVQHPQQEHLKIQTDMECTQMKLEVPVIITSNYGFDQCTIQISLFNYLVKTLSSLFVSKASSLFTDKKSHICKNYDPKFLLDNLIIIEIENIEATSNQDILNVRLHCELYRDTDERLKNNNRNEILGIQ
ncbi:hypothetical protein BpHYR1_048919 [Brachionus plicatilis]|uniref:Uncharacterized protein n=1 Tax=Brachionus plicatilis TaxID=10195 RepID=A0A3M7PLV3_BRAPC|nr:hypothetical protein BpHYR1_048919 [Brachionus plicatilis]